MLRVAIQMDPIEAVNIESDTTFLQAMEAQNRGYPVWIYDFGLQSKRPVDADAIAIVIALIVLLT